MSTSSGSADSGTCVTCKHPFSDHGPFSGVNSVCNVAGCDCVDAWDGTVWKIVEDAPQPAADAAVPTTASVLRHEVEIITRTLNYNWRAVMSSDDELGPLDGLAEARESYDRMAIETAMSQVVPPEWDSWDEYDDWDKIAPVLEARTKAMQAAKVEWVLSRLAAALRAESDPCRCDPPGSGEEYCTNDCFLVAYYSLAERMLKVASDLEEELTIAGPNDVRVAVKAFAGLVARSIRQAVNGETR